MINYVLGNPMAQKNPSKLMDLDGFYIIWYDLFSNLHHLRYPHIRY
jgi:hypothetical protein